MVYAMVYAAAAAASPPPTAWAAFDDPARAAKLATAYPQVDRVMREFVARENVPGAAWGIVIDGELVHLGTTGLREVETSQPVRGDSVFRIASMTKSFTAMAILKLRDAGKLSLDDPAERHVPELRGLRPLTSDAPAITLRHLLTQSAGFPEDNPWGDQQLGISEEAFSRLMREGIPFSNPPGVAYEYSNYGFAILGRVIANVSGLPYTQYVEREILRPLGMASTTLEPRSVPPARIASKDVLPADQAALKTTKKRENTALITLALVNESEGITCLAEEIPEGISLADLLKERRSIDVPESYLVLANLDTALTQLDEARLNPGKLRLEDIFLLTGFPREDARCAKLLSTPLNQWPAFNIMVRAHPTLASMAGRGTDPATLLPPSKFENSTDWHGGWLAALGKLLIGIESPAGVQPDPAAATRERESLTRLLDDEIVKISEARASLRGDFLARFARVMQHHDLVKPLPQATSGETERLAAKSAAASATRSKAAAPARANGKTTAPSTTTAPATDAPAAGFAELLFRNTGGEPEPPDAPIWARGNGSADAPPVLPDELLLTDAVPRWLKAAVFIGGSMILGGMLAHLSGNALWQRMQTQAPAVPPPPATAAQPQSVSAGTPASPAPPKAIPVPEDLPVVPPAPPPPARPDGVSLSLPPGAGGLREQIAPAPPK